MIALITYIKYLQNKVSNLDLDGENEHNMVLDHVITEPIVEIAIVTHLQLEK